MSSYVLLDLLSVLRKRDIFYAMSLINSMIQEHKC